MVKCQKCMCEVPAEQLVQHVDVFTGKRYLSCCEGDPASLLSSQEGLSRSSDNSDKRVESEHSTQNGVENMVDEMEFEVAEAKTFERITIPNGVYRCEVGAMRNWTGTDGRTSLIIDFKMLDGPAIGKTISGWTSPRITENTKLGKWLTALKVEIKVGAKINMMSMIGKKCRVVTTTKKSKKDGTEFSTVSDVLEV